MPAPGKQSPSSPGTDRPPGARAMTRAEALRWWRAGYQAGHQAAERQARRLIRHYTPEQLIYARTQATHTADGQARTTRAWKRRLQALLEANPRTVIESCPHALFPAAAYPETIATAAAAIHAPHNSPARAIFTGTSKPPPPPEPGKQDIRPAAICQQRFLAAGQRSRSSTLNWHGTVWEGRAGPGRNDGSSHAHHRLPRGTPARRCHLRLSRLPAASTCSISLPRSRTRAKDAAAVIRWPGCSPWGSRR